jgi:hypothetical protein
MGVALPPPEELTDAQLSAKLWGVIEALAFLGRKEVRKRFLKVELRNGSGYDFTIAVLCPMGRKREYVPYSSWWRRAVEEALRACSHGRLSQERWPVNFYADFRSPEVEN